MTVEAVADVVVVGGGLIGLSVAAELALNGVQVTIVHAERPGPASPAAAGMLAPGVEWPALVSSRRSEPADTDGRADAPRSHATDPTGGSRATATRSFARRSLTMYRGFLDRMADHGTVELRVDGVLQIATNDSEAESLRCRIGERAVWMDARQVLEMEPALRGAVGGLLHSEEGAVDNVALLATLARFIARELSAIHRVNAAAVALQRDGDLVRVVLDGGGSVRGSRVVLAAGAWTPNLRGLPRPLPVAPLRGQMLAMEGELLNHVVYAPGGYALPRAGRTLVGATMEEVGFDAGTTDAGIDKLRRFVQPLLPALNSATEHSRWSGLRPVTPDFLPILGAEPRWPAITYACGHSRNGVLLAPATALAITKLLVGGSAEGLAPFSVERSSLRQSPSSG